MSEIGDNGELYLFDSFEGLPIPHQKDQLLHDIFGLGDIEKYAGTIAFPRQILDQEVAGTPFPSNKLNAIEGWITPTLLEGISIKVKFAYLDMDFYQSTFDVLVWLKSQMVSGGMIILDDFGSFSSGVETAAREVLATYPESFTLRFIEGSKFAVLEKR
jgi:hypothetical protein